MRSTSARRDRSSGRVATPLIVVLLAVVAVLLVGWFLLRGHDEPGAPTSSAAKAPVGDETPDLPQAGSRESASAPGLQAPGAAASPLTAAPDQSLPGRAIAGSLVRASDGSAVGPAEVIALERLAGSRGESELMRVRSDTDGHFELRAERGPTGFRVLIPGPGQPRDARPSREVGVTVEWEGENPAAHNVRLVLATGWRLDVRVADAAGLPQAGVAVRAGEQQVTTDRDGLAVLLDLPEDGKDVSFVAQVAGQPTVTQVAPAPAAGRLRAEAQLTLR